MKQKPQGLSFAVIIIIAISMFGTASAEEYTGNVELNGFDGSIYLPEATAHGISYLTLYFAETYKGKYTVVLTTYPTFSPEVEGALKYFSITPEFNIKKGSSMDIISNNPIEVYQLTDNQWTKLPRPASIYVNTYRVQIASIGTFAIKNIQYLPDTRVVGELSPSEIQERMNLNMTEIKSKDEQIYTKLKTILETIFTNFRHAISVFTGRKF